MLKCLTKCVIASIVFSSLYACHPDAQNETNKQSIRKFSSNSNEVVTDIPSDTLSFQKFSDLVTFFKTKGDSVEAIRKRLLTFKKNNSNVNSDSADVLNQLSNDLIIEKRKSVYKFVTNNDKNTESFGGLKYLVTDRYISFSFLDSLFRLFPEDLQKSSEGKWLYQMIDKRKERETKKEYSLEVLDLPFIDVNGNLMRLKDINSKYILLDFWSSWCVPCRLENRRLVKEKHLVERDNLTIVAISLDDNKEKWIKASKADNLNYLNISDLKGLESLIAKEFRINSIPYNVVITKEGLIVANNLWGKELISFANTLK